MLTADDIAQALTEPGDQITDPATGVTFTLTEEPDYTASISDFDCYGEVYGLDNPRRPDHPRGRTISYGNGGAWYWIPPEDVPDADLDSFGHQVAEICCYGFHGLIVTATTEEQNPSTVFPDVTYTDTRELTCAALFGLEYGTDPSYTQDVMSELVHKVLSDLPMYD